jgi:hypothetical protein
MEEEKPRVFMERPREVVWAIQLIFASLVLGLIAVPFRPEIIKNQLIGFMIISVIFSLLFTSFLLIMIFHGKNWARLLFIIPLFIGLPFAFPTIIKVLQNSPVTSVIALIKICLQIMAAVLLLQKPSRDWFKFIKLQKLLPHHVT